MIADFLETNKLNGRIISFPSNVSIGKACIGAKISPASAARAIPFVNEKMDFFVVIALMGEKVSTVEAADLFALGGLEEPSSSETSTLTGFEKEFFPPVGVFGATVKITESAEKKRHLLFPLGHRDFLLIETKEIMRAMEMSVDLL